MENSLTESQEINIYKHQRKNNFEYNNEENNKSEEEIKEKMNRENGSPIKNNPTLQEKLKQIFQSRINKIENSGKKQIPEELKYNSDESYSSEDINIRACYRNKAQEEKIKNRINKKEENEKEEKEIILNENNIELSDNEIEKNDNDNIIEEKEIVENDNIMNENNDNKEEEEIKLKENNINNISQENKIENKENQNNEIELNISNEEEEENKLEEEKKEEEEEKKLEEEKKEEEEEKKILNNNIKNNNENKQTLKEKLLLLMSKKNKKDEEEQEQLLIKQKQLIEQKKREIEKEEEEEFEEEEEEKNYDKPPSKFIRDDNLEEEKFEEEIIEEKPKKNVSGLRNIIDMLKAKKLEKEKIEEKNKKNNFINENFSDEEIMKEEKEKKIKEEEKRKKEEEEEKKRDEKMKERKKRQEERKKRKEEEENKRKEEEEKKKLEEEKKRKKIEEEKRKKEEEEKRKKLEEENKKRKKIEDEKKKEEENKKKKKLEEENKKKKKLQEEENKKKKLQEEENKKKKESEERKKKFSEIENHYNKIKKNKEENLKTEKKETYNREIPMTSTNYIKKSYTNYMNNEREPVMFEELSNKNDRSFDSGNAYQKPVKNTLYTTQNNNGGRSSTNLIYTKKGMRGRSNEKVNANGNNNNNYNNVNINNNNFSNNIYNFQDISNGYMTNTNNVNNIYNNSINSTLNSSYQDIGYRKQSQVYCKSPTRYSRQTNTLLENRSYGSPKNINRYNNNLNNINPYDYFENNRIKPSLTSMNSMTNIHNYINMNGMGNSLTYKNNSSYNNSMTYNNNSMSSYNNNYNNHYYYPQPSFSINLEDLMILEEKLSEIINALSTNKVMYNECFEWWNYYYNCSLFRTIEKAFKGEDSGIVQSSIKYELLTIMLCYDVSFDNNLLDKVFIMIKALLNLNHKNLLIICEYILSKISNESLGNVWVYKLKNLVSSLKNSTEEIDYLSFNGHSLSSIDKIKCNTNYISNDIRIILKNYPMTQLTDNLVSLYKTINDKSYEEINKFFREYIMRVENPNASVLASVVLRENSNFYPVEPPYLKTKNLKNYTLVLDLDETIIHFKVNPNNDTEGVLRVRPGIFEFLETLGKYYEIIVFTAATQDYADLLIDAIEENKIYFDYRLYRQHAVIIDNDFVKDLNRLGRPLDKIIIVDNMPQNFRLQKENGINIRAFWGEDPYDSALVDLTHILVNIAKEGGDVRKGLAKYRDDIVKKVTTNISKHHN